MCFEPASSGGHHLQQPRRIAWGDVAQQCRNFTKVGQKTIVIAHAPSTITQALNAKGFGVRIRRTDIPYHFEVEIMEKNRFTLTAKA